MLSAEARTGSSLPMCKILLHLIYKLDSSGGGEEEREKEGLRPSVPPHASPHRGIAGYISGTVEKRNGSSEKVRNLPKITLT